MKIKKVLVSQPKPTTEKSPYFDIAEKYGVKIDFRPFIKVESLTAKESLCGFACYDTGDNEVFLYIRSYCTLYPEIRPI